MADDNNTPPAAPPTVSTTANGSVISSVNLTDAEIAAREQANIAAAPVAAVEASGAIMEKGARASIDVSHPAVDNNPRANTTKQQNQIDFNDPALKDDEAVQKALDSQ